MSNLQPNTPHFLRTLLPTNVQDGGISVCIQLSVLQYVQLSCTFVSVSSTHVNNAAHWTRLVMNIKSVSTNESTGNVPIDQSQARKLARCSSLDKVSTRDLVISINYRDKVTGRSLLHPDPLVVSHHMIRLIIRGLPLYQVARSVNQSNKSFFMQRETFSFSHLIFKLTNFCGN